MAAPDHVLHLGDCREVLATLPEPAHAVVTDPPYGIGFMDERWDGGVAFEPATWRAVLAAMKPGGWLLAFGATRTYHRIATAVEDAGFEIRDSLAWIYGQGRPRSPNDLKPAWEPIVLARRPLAGTLAANVEAHGCGRLGIDEARVPCDVPRLRIEDRRDPSLDASRVAYGSGLSGSRCTGTTTAPRWPANVVHDGSPEVVAEIGPGARFFYCSKASKRDRGPGNTHPTVKPIALMRWLVRLACPPGGLVIDPCMGSGSTGVAALLEGRRFAGIEENPEYLEIAARRLAAAAVPA